MEPPRGDRGAGRALGEAAACGVRVDNVSDRCGQGLGHLRVPPGQLVPEGSGKDVGVPVNRMVATAAQFLRETGTVDDDGHPVAQGESILVFPINVGRHAHGGHLRHETQPMSVGGEIGRRRVADMSSAVLRPGGLRHAVVYIGAQL